MVKTSEFSSSVEKSPLQCDVEHLEVNSDQTSILAGVLREFSWMRNLSQ